MRSPLPPRGPGMPEEVVVGGRPYYWHDVSIDELAKPIPLPREFPEGIGETRKQALRMIGKIKVQNSIVQPHRLIGRLLDEDNERREKQRSSAYSYSWDKPLFEAQWEQRRLRILNALFCAMDAIGFAPWLRGKDGRDLGIRIGAQSISLRLERAQRPLTRKKSVGGIGADPLRFDILVSCGSEEARNPWSDVENGRIERQLRAIAVEIIVAGEIKYRESVRAGTIGRYSERHNSRRMYAEEKPKSKDKSAKDELESKNSASNGYSMTRMHSSKRTKFVPMSKLCELPYWRFRTQSRTRGLIPGVLGRTQKQTGSIRLRVSNSV